MAPSWRLLAKFGEVELPGPLLTTQVCPCSYCWCGKCGIQRLPQSVFRSLFSAEAREVLLETLGGNDLTAGEGETAGLASSNLMETGVNDDRDLNGSSSGSNDVRELSAAAEESRQTAGKSSAQLGEDLQASTLGSAAFSDSATTEESSEDEDEQNGSGSFEAPASSSQTNSQTGGENSNSNNGSSTSDLNSQLSTTSDDPSSSALSSDLSGGETLNFTRQNDSINSTANFSFGRKIKAMQSTFLYVRISQWAAKFECRQCERTFVRKSSFVAHTATHADQLENISRSFRRSDVIGHQRNSVASLSGFELHRRLSALQSTFMDLNVTASNGSYQSESQSQKLRNTVSTTSEALIGTSSDGVSDQQKSKRRLLCRQSRLFIKKQVSTFSCSYCKRSFMKRGNLVIHLRKHLEIRPFRCTFEKCSRQFTRAAPLAAHAQSSHENNLSSLVEGSSSNSNTHENSKSQPVKRKSKKSDKLQGNLKNNSFIAHVDTSVINQEPLQNTWSNATVEAEAVKNVAHAGGEPLKNLIRSAGPIKRQVSQRDNAQAGSLSMVTSVGDQVHVDQDEDTHVGEISQSAASSEAPKLGTSRVSSTPVVDSRGCQTAHELIDVDLVPVCTSDTTKLGLSEEIPTFSLRPVIHEIVTEADETENRDQFDRTEAGGDSSCNEASSAVVCVNCNKPLAKKQEEHENSKSSNGNVQPGSLMYCPACGTCQLDFPNVIFEASEDPVSPFDDSQDSDCDEGPHVDSQDAESCANSKPRRKSVRIFERISDNRVVEESSESSDEDDNADDSVWTDSETETEDSEESTDDDGDSDDDDNAAAASSHELSKINDDDESDEDEQTESIPGQSRQQNVRKKALNEKPVERKFWCVECGEGLSDRKALNLHLLEHDPVLPFKCGLCTARFETRKKQLTHHKTHKDKTGRFNCNQCEYSTQNSSCIMRHLRVHSGEKLYTCDDCGNAFSQLTNLKKHMRVHNGERPYQCDQCPQLFKQLNHLQDHKRIHSGERPYKCEVCKKTFSDLSNFTRHMRVHSGERPFECDVCKKAFSDRSTLNKHKRVHSGERPYKCDVCNTSFSVSSNLIVHKRIHSGKKPYECDVCKKTFTQSSKLKRHKRMHSGEKLYKCDQCSKFFARLETLKTHMRVHSGERPYECHKCSRSFTQKSDLQRHQKVVHRRSRAK